MPKWEGLQANLTGLLGSGGRSWCAPSSRTSALFHEGLLAAATITSVPPRALGGAACEVPSAGQ